MTGREVKAGDFKSFEVVVHEREWTSEGLTFYQAKAQGRSGRLYERTIVRSIWGPSPGRVYEEVRVAAGMDATPPGTGPAAADEGGGRGRAVGDVP